MRKSGKVSAELLESIGRDNPVRVGKIVKEGRENLNGVVDLSAEFGLEESEEIPLLFYCIMSGVGVETIRVLMKGGMDIHYCSTEGVGAVDFAVKYRRRDLFDLLKEEGIDFSGSRRKSGMTPLMLAAAFDDVETAEYLLKAGAEADTVDAFGMTALDYARKMGQKKMQDFLEKRGAVYAVYKK